MMGAFDEYALFYDSYYSFKDYDAECGFLIDLAGRYYTGEVRRILDMGCGTAGHSLSLARKNLHVVGFDLSETMVEAAREKIAGISSGQIGDHFDLPEIRVGDVRTYRDASVYDLCISMFAVMGYLTGNDDFLAGLMTARAHLPKDGLLIFDVWHGPAVLTQKPERRFQEFSKDGSRVLRFVTPEVDLYRHLTKVHYRIMEIRDGKVLVELEELHEMRYFFVQELRLFLTLSRFEMISVRPFMGGDEQPGVNDWNICVVARAIGDN
jgi:SAM-dependent methyltransferase